MLSANQLSTLATHGGGFALEAGKFHQDDLVRIAAAGAGKGQLGSRLIKSTRRWWRRGRPRRGSFSPVDHSAWRCA
jgi:hypothetical protein